MSPAAARPTNRSATPDVASALAVLAEWLPRRERAAVREAARSAIDGGEPDAAGLPDWVRNAVRSGGSAGCAWPLLRSALAVSEDRGRRVGEAAGRLGYPALIAAASAALAGGVASLLRVRYGPLLADASNLSLPANPFQLMSPVGSVRNAGAVGWSLVYLDVLRLLSFTVLALAGAAGCYLAVRRLRGRPPHGAVRRLPFGRLVLRHDAAAEVLSHLGVFVDARRPLDEAAASVAGVCRSPSAARWCERAAGRLRSGGRLFPRAGDDARPSVSVPAGWEEASLTGDALRAEAVVASAAADAAMTRSLAAAHAALLVVTAVLLIGTLLSFSLPLLSTLPFVGDGPLNLLG